MPCNGDSTVFPSSTTPTFTGPASAQRFKATQGTTLSTGYFALSAGWGTSPVLTVVRGTDQAASITIQAKATVGANPTVTLTFKDGTWTNPPIVVCGRTELTAATAAPAAAVSNEWVPTTISATQIVFTFNGTPVATSTYGPTVTLTVNLTTGAWTATNSLTNTVQSGTIGAGALASFNSQIKSDRNLVETFAAGSGNLLPGTQVAWT